MTRNEHLLVILMEECDELSQRASKALRFGLHEVQAGQDLTNAERLVGEFVDLLAAMDMLDDAGCIEWPSGVQVSRELTRPKRLKVEGYFGISRNQGTLD